MQVFLARGLLHCAWLCECSQRTVLCYVIIMYLQIFERHSKFVKKGKEKKVWESITVDMMSDEEKRGDMYVCHQPEYRSEKFTSFLNKLDERCSKKHTSHSRL